MPAFAIRTRAVFVSVDDHQFWMVRGVRGRRMDMQGPELLPERQMLLWRQYLVAEEEHEIVGQSPLQFLLLVRAEGLRQIDAGDFGPDDWRQFVNVDGLIWRGGCRPVSIARAIVATK